MYSNFRPAMMLIAACLVMALGITRCQGDSASDPEGAPSTAEVATLEVYNTIVSYEGGILANPAAVKYDGDSLLYVYDVEKKQVLALNENVEITHEFGGEGRGPGEVLWFNNIYLNSDYLYIVDPVQFRIIRYSLDGEVEGSLDYGQKGSQSLPPPAPQSLIPRAKNITNKPFVTASGNVLLPATGPREDFSSLYTLADWEGNALAEIGDIPEGSAFVLDYKQYQATVDDQKVPAFYKPNVFPVNDYTNSDEFYFIYTAFPKIAKYNSTGEKLWEEEIPATTELESFFAHFFDVSERMSGKERIGLDTYVSGVSSKSGYLYLVLGKYGFVETSNDLWIHEFTNEGELNQRFRLISEDVNLVSIFDIDFANQRIFVVTEGAEIRAYPF